MPITDSTVYGRSDTADVTVANDTVSARHCELSVTGGTYTLTDLNSSNGTFVNGKRVTTVALKSGDRVHMGTAAFEFRAGRLERQHSYDTPDTPAGQQHVTTGTQDSKTPLFALIGLVAIAAIVAIVVVNRDGDPNDPTPATITAVPSTTNANVTPAKVTTVLIEGVVRFMVPTPASVVKQLDVILLVEDSIVSPLNCQRGLGLTLRPS